MSSAIEHTLVYRDVAARDLELHLGLPERPAIAVQSLTCDGWAIALRILAASHQVVVQRPGMDHTGSSANTATFTETVACDLGDGHVGADPGDGVAVDSLGAGRSRPRRLPEHLSRRTALGNYRFLSSVRHVDGEAFDRQVETLLASLGEPSYAVSAVFPGATSAITALQADLEGTDAISWRTWHTYPQTAEIVFTLGRLSAARPSRQDLR